VEGVESAWLIEAVGVFGRSAIAVLVMGRAECKSRVDTDAVK
jgi:hypothetical protein